MIRLYQYSTGAVILWSKVNLCQGQLIYFQSNSQNRPMDINGLMSKGNPMQLLCKTINCICNVLSNNCFNLKLEIFQFWPKTKMDLWLIWSLLTKYGMPILGFPWLLIISKFDENDSGTELSIFLYKSTFFVKNGVFD